MDVAIAEYLRCEDKRTRSKERVGQRSGDSRAGTSHMSAVHISCARVHLLPAILEQARVVLQSVVCWMSLPNQRLQRIRPCSRV